MRIRNLYRAAMLLILVLVLVVIVLFQQLNDSMHLANRISLTRYQDYVLSNGLRQTSDDLTRMVRRYAVTGDPLYRGYFDEILAIRNGEMPRPQKYLEIPYWDYVLATGERPGEAGAAVPIRTLVRQGAFTDGELALLQEAEDRSNHLVLLENEVMDAVAGSLEGNAGNYRLQDETLAAMLRLHGQEYHQAKQQIMLPLVQLTRVVSRNLFNLRSDLFRNILDDFWYILAAAGLATAAGIFVLWHAKRRGSPLKSRPWLLSLFVVIALLSSIIWVLQLYGEQEYIHHHLNRRFNAWHLSDGLRQTSDDLTRMVRLYAATGEQRYRDYFDEILAIRNGLARRPVDYHEIPYWDILLATGQFAGKYEEPVPITVLAESVGFTEAELALLEKAETESNDLVILENEVMETVARRIQDGGGQYLLEGETIEALLRLHGEEYHLAKLRVMEPLVELARTVEASLAAENEHSLERVGQINVALMFSMIFSLLFSVLAASAWRRSSF